MVLRRQVHRDKANAVRATLACRKIEVVGDMIRQLATEHYVADGSGGGGGGNGAAGGDANGAPFFADVTTVTTARIPIASFVHVASGLQCDLCCDNILPVHNTRLLKVRASRFVGLLLFRSRRRPRCLLLLLLLLLSSMLMMI